MHQPRLAAGLAKRALHGAVVGAGHLDGHQVILQAVLLDRFPELQGGQLQRGPLVFDDRRGDEHLAIEVAKHPLRAGFGTIHGDDAEPFRAYGLNARLDHAIGLAQYGWTDCAGFARIAFRSHSNCSPVMGKRVNTFPKTDSWNGSIDFLSKRTTYQGISPIICVSLVFHEVERWIPVRVSRRSLPARSRFQKDGRAVPTSAQPPTPPSLAGGSPAIAIAAVARPATSSRAARRPSLRRAASATSSTIASPPHVPPTPHAARCAPRNREP